MANSYTSPDFARDYLSEMNFFEEVEGQPDEFGPGFHNLGRFYPARLMKWLHEEFASGRHVGKRLLDFGSGPNIHSVLSASGIFDEIIMMDINSYGLSTIKSWTDSEPNAHDWSPFAKYVAKLEGKNSATEVEDRTKKSIKRFIECDLWDKVPLTDRTPPVDCVTAVLSLQTYSTSFTNNFTHNLQKVAAVLARGGSLLAVLVLNVERYYVKGNMYNSMAVSMNTVLEGFSDAGFIDIRFVGHPSREKSVFYLFLSAKRSLQEEAYKAD